MKGDGHVEDTENKARWHKPRPFKEVMAELREELSRYTELLSKDEVGKAAAKNILDEVYREVERVRMEIEYQDKDGDYVMNSAEFLSEFTIGSLSQLYENGALIWRKPSRRRQTMKATTEEKPNEPV